MMMIELIKMIIILGLGIKDLKGVIVIVLWLFFECFLFNLSDGFNLTFENINI